MTHNDNLKALIGAVLRIDTKELSIPLYGRIVGIETVGKRSKPRQTYGKSTSLIFERTNIERLK
jgi:hypothetical protein